MKLRIFVNPKTFKTAFIARTSRGEVGYRRSNFLFVEAKDSIGVGEGSPLPGLSLDGNQDWNRFQAWLGKDEEIDVPADDDSFIWAKTLADRAGCGQSSSIVFALETAALSLLSGQPERYYNSRFTTGHRGLEINGLVWMDDLVAMRRQAEDKVREGFTTIKFKIGSFDWEKEKSLLADFRRIHPADEIVVRVDANGAYTEEQALRVLDDLYTLGIHSIEQPIRAGQYGAMRRLVREGAVPVALDEELITRMPPDEVNDMLLHINAPYLVLKPSLIGGLAATKDRIAQATRQGWGWWITSSLETPIALTALAQFAALYDNPLPHGLSTGQIFDEAFAHPNVLDGNALFFDPEVKFDLKKLRQPDLPAFFG